MNSQPSPAVFLKSFLEFNGSNVISILAFDSRSIRTLLDPKNSEHFTKDFPIFYLNKIRKGNNIQKFYYRSAIDNAYTTNQVGAI